MQQYGTSLPYLSYLNKIFIIIHASYFLLSSVLKKAAGLSLDSFFGLSAVMALQGHIYEFITYPFVGRGLLEVIINCLMLWFIGSELEALWGRKRYLKFLLSSTLTAGFIYITISLFFFSDSIVYALPLAGFSGMVSALCVAYAILYPDRTFTFMLLFPMRAKYFCWILVGISLYSGIFTPAGAGAWGHLGAMFGGFVYMWYVSRPKNLKFKVKKKSSHLKLIKSGEEDDKEYHKPKYWQ